MVRGGKEKPMTVPQARTRQAKQAATDGIYVIRTPVPAETLDAPGTVTAYKRLSRLDRDLRSIQPTTWTCADLAPARRPRQGPTC